MQYISLDKDEQISGWHKWFAWYPVEVESYKDYSRRMVWLEFVYRCGTVHYYRYSGREVEWKYKEINRV